MSGKQGQDQFASKKTSATIEDMVVGFVLYQKMMEQLAQAESLQKLNRGEEALKVLASTEQMCTAYQQANPNDRAANLSLALFYNNAGDEKQAEQILTRLLAARQFTWTEQERLILMGTLQKIQRERPADLKSDERLEGFTQIYCCQNCGRLHNYISMPCPNCDWHPPSIEATARSMLLSNTYIEIPSLIYICKEIANGKTIDQVVPNLKESAAELLVGVELRDVAEKIYSLLVDNEARNHRSIPMLRGCPSCGSRIMFSGEKTCDECQNSLRWPEAIRALVCIDNLLWFIENWIEGPWTDQLSELVCLWILMSNNLLRKQAAPSESERRYAMDLLRGIDGLKGPNSSAYVEINSPHDMTIHVVKDKMDSSTQSFVTFLYMEIEAFVSFMEKGILLK